MKCSYIVCFIVMYNDIKPLQNFWNDLAIYLQPTGNMKQLCDFYKPMQIMVKINIE